MDKAPSEETTISPEPTQVDTSKFRWIIFAMACLAFFIFFRLPSLNIDKMIQHQINTQLRKQGVDLIAQKSTLRFFPTLKYELTRANITIKRPKFGIELDQFWIKPSLSSLVRGKLGGTAFLRKENGTMEVDFSSSPPDIDLDIEIIKLDIDKLGILSKLPVAVKLKGLMSGNINIQGNTKNLQKTNGSIDIDIEKLLLPSQKITIDFFSLGY